MKTVKSFKDKFPRDNNRPFTCATAEVRASYEKSGTSISITLCFVPVARSAMAQGCAESDFYCTIQASFCIGGALGWSGAFLLGSRSVCSAAALACSADCHGNRHCRNECRGPETPHGSMAYTCKEQPSRSRPSVSVRPSCAESVRRAPCAPLLVAQVVHRLLLDRNNRQMRPKK